MVPSSVAPILSFRDIVKSYGGTRAVDAVSLDVAPGEFCSLVGPSGCGKTTLLRIAAGFVDPDAGTVLLGGAPVSSVPPRKRGLGFVFQSYALFPTKTVAQNIGFSPTLKGEARARVASRVEDLSRLMRLDGLHDRYPHELSGGQQQRVALARALAGEPKVLLLDEPLSALDAKIRAHLRGEIRRAVETLGLTAVYVTHDQEEALSISDRVAVMNGGRLLQVGSPMDVYLRPADPFVAGFIGATNTLACRVAGPDRVDIGAIPLAARVPANLEPGRRGTFSIRPEHLTVGPEDGQGVPATLVGLSFLGPTLRLTLATVDDQILHADVPAVDWLARPHETGARLRWSPHAGCATVFPAEG